MTDNEPLNQGSVATHQATQAAVLDVDFEARWSKWLARGAVLDQRGRRTLNVSAGVLVVGAIVAYGLLR